MRSRSTRRGDSEARRKRTALAAEKELQFPRRTLGGVGAVDEVIWETQSQISADGAGGGLGGVRRAHKATGDLDRAFALDPHRDDRGGGDELDQPLEKGFLAVLFVVLLGQLPAHVHEPHLPDVEALVLDAAQDLPDQTPPYTIAFYEYERLFHGNCAAGTAGFYRRRRPLSSFLLLRTRRIGYSTCGGLSSRT